MTPKSILVPIDFSVSAEHALDYACGLAEKLGATIHVVNAIGATLPELSVALSEQMMESLRREHAKELQRIVEPRRALAKFGEVLVDPGDARDAILAVAKRLDVDLIVMGTHGRRGVSRVLLGSVAEDVVRRAPCPVLAVRSRKGEER